MSIKSNVIEEIINESNYQEFGARKLNKIIVDHIENQIIEDLLEGKKVVNITSLNQVSSIK